MGLGYMNLLWINYVILIFRMHTEVSTKTNKTNKKIKWNKINTHTTCSHKPVGRRAPLTQACQSLAIWSYFLLPSVRFTKFSPVYSWMLSSYVFFCLPLFLEPKMVNSQGLKSKRCSQCSFRCLTTIGSNSSLNSSLYLFVGNVRFDEDLSHLQG